MIDAETALGRVGPELSDFDRLPKKNILIVDDEPGILESLEEVFNQEFNVFTAKDGKEAIDLLGYLRFDLVTLDLSLPEIEGVDVLKRIRELLRPPPVIIITGHSTHERAKECANSAVQGYIEKPFDPFELLERVTKFLSENKYTENGVTNSELLSVKELSNPIKKALGFINHYYTRPIRPKNVADHVSIPRKHLGRKFKKEIRQSMDDYLNSKRAQKAKELLLQKRSAKLYEISYQSGFKSEAHFLRVFKRLTGTTPTDFINRDILY